jgi:splicing factor 45
MYTLAEEARKHGILEHCFVHQMPIYVPEDEAVRVFITFSGLVGAWKAVKAFDGRFFGGRTVKAKFYDETAFATRTLHL